MIIIVLFAITGFVLGCIWQRGLWDDVIEYIGGFMMSLLLALAFALVGSLVAWAIPSQTYIEDRSVKIMSLQDGTNISGSFFLGCGSIDGEMKFTFYVEEGDKYKLMQLPARLVNIKYSDYPAVHQYKRRLVKGIFINYFSVIMPSDDNYVITVPKGTIKNDFTLDAK